MAASKAWLLASLIISTRGLGLELPKVKGFTPLHKKDGVTVSILRENDGEPWILGETRLEFSANEIFELLRDFANYKVLFADSVETATVLSSTGDGTRLHLVWPLPFPMSDRDAIVRYQGRVEKTLSTISWRDDVKKDDPEDGLRIKTVRGQTTVTDLGNNSAQVVYLYYGDLGGSLPEFIKESAWKEEPIIYFRALRKALLKKKAGQ